MMNMARNCSSLQNNGKIIQRNINTINWNLHYGSRFNCNYLITNIAINSCALCYNMGQFMAKFRKMYSNTTPAPPHLQINITLKKPWWNRSRSRPSMCSFGDFEDSTFLNPLQLMVSYNFTINWWITQVTLRKCWDIGLENILQCTAIN